MRRSTLAPDRGTGRPDRFPLRGAARDLSSWATDHPGRARRLRRAEQFLALLRAPWLFANKPMALTACKVVDGAVPVRSAPTYPTCRRSGPQQDGEPRAPSLISTLATKNRFFAKFPERRSTDRPYFTALPQISWTRAGHSRSGQGRPLAMSQAWTSSGWRSNLTPFLSVAHANWASLAARATTTELVAADVAQRRGSLALRDGVRVREQLAVAECREPGWKARIDGDQAGPAPLGRAGRPGQQVVDGLGVWSRDEV